MLLAVTLAIALATTRMTTENLTVSVLGCCEMMANASMVYREQTGTLAQGSVTVVAGAVGVHCKFVHNLSDNKVIGSLGLAGGGRLAGGSLPSLRPRRTAERRQPQGFD